MYSNTRVAATLAVSLCFACGVGTASAATVQPPFSDNNQYQIRIISSLNSLIPGIPAPYGGVAFAPNDMNTLFIGGHVHESDAAIYAVGITRDAQGHINGFQKNSRRLAWAPGLPGLTPAGRGIGRGLAVGPGGVLFYTSIDGGLGMVEPGNETLDRAPDRKINLKALNPPIVEAGPLAFVPPRFAGQKGLKLATGGGGFYGLQLAADGNGTFNIAKATQWGTLDDMGPGVGTSAVGLAYVAAGNKAFPVETVLALDWDFNTGSHSDLLAYQTDINGNPDFKAGPRTVIAEIGGSAMAVDPLTGDLFIAGFWGSHKLVTGFALPPLPVYGAANFTVPEPTDAGTPTPGVCDPAKPADIGTAKIVVKRGGSLDRPVSVNYSTSVVAQDARYAVPGVNYSDVSGTLDWIANDRKPKCFTVPVMRDGVFSAALRVDLNLSLAGSGEPLPPAALYIRNTDPNPPSP